MEDPMYKVLLGMTFAGLMVSTLGIAQAQQPVTASDLELAISTGLQGGGYWSAGDRLQSVARDAGITVQNFASTGSLANLEQLSRSGSPVNLAFAQADALEYFVNENPRSDGLFEELQTIGEECVFIISESDSDIDSVEDMEKSQRMHLGIKSPQSGIWVTFNYMSTLVPELRSVSLIYGDTVGMMNEMAHPKTNIDRAVMVVQGTDAHSPEIDMAAANPDKYQFVELDDKRLTKAADGGEPTYHKMKVRSSVAEKVGKVKTICVRGLLLANTQKLSSEELIQVRQLVNEHWGEIHPVQ
ncbi:MAG: TAXI family TRAP transporter solute-binding subunit [Pseudomonadota bacterium]